MIGAAVLLLAPMLAQQQVPTQISQVKYARGQDVVPVYEGWLKNSDGGFTFVFGYFNRNWEEELAIPAGSDNKIEPGEPDRGQPTYFLPRRQSWLFRVKVPKDWGNKELVWSITAHGRTEKAYASLMPEEEISERIIMTRGNLNPGEDDPNHPPSITLDPVDGARAGVPVALNANVTDDGLPKPRAVSTKASGIPPAQSNTATAERPRGLTVSWLQLRGPAKVTFAGNGPSTTAQFAAPGDYVIRATANDGALQTSVELKVNVK